MNDAISRQDVLKALIERRNDIRALIERNKMPAEEASTYWCEIHGIYYAIDLIEALPSADRPKGEWEHEDGVYGIAFCSNCEFELRMNDTNFCPNCGADMRGDTE